MATEPVIGICAVHERARWSFWEQTVHLVADSYVVAVQRTGALAVVLPVDARAPVGLLERIDGLLLIGGADVDPSS
ncbi:MAG TPA: gamma-glutamyl-gamma-aminobutyrate hydrolase family protein, partial [Candidatus Limnocylindria bacterium]|nr:gamma-glutamyl-gamma-aminobutyrate hydrolase family protein [Candidatus Limnocylindria bacterium]